MFIMLVPCLGTILNESVNKKIDGRNFSIGEKVLKS